ncbi:hypothetical protein Tco_0072030 [Tanacetum coccineum]
MAYIDEIAKDAKFIKIEDQLLGLIMRQMETELMLEDKFRDLCEEVSNFVKESEDVMMVNESQLSVREKHTFVSKMNLGTLVAGDGVASIKRHRRDQSSDGVRILATASGFW